MRKINHILCLFFVALLFACGGKGEHDAGVVTDSDSVSHVPQKIDSVYVNGLTNDQVDSLEFRLTHHYTINDNFLVMADSIKLVPREDELGDTCYVFKDQILAVVKVKRNLAARDDSLELSNADANLMKSIEEAGKELDDMTTADGIARDVPTNDTVVADTVWVKVATVQNTMGWMTESTLLKHTVPNDNLSVLLHSLTDTRLLWMGGMLMLGVLGVYLHRAYARKKINMVKLNEMDSLYPSLFVFLVALLACLYASIQNFVPEYWQEFYFHPTLNPFMLPHVMAILVTIVWTIIVVFIALCMEIYNNFKFGRGFIYFFEIMGASMFVYLFISWTTKIYIGYIIFILLTWFLWVIYNDYVKLNFQCPNCGKKLRAPGKCPNCGTILE